MTRCAFVPLNPNELTPAMRERLPLGHGVALIGNLQRQPQERFVFLAFRYVQVRRNAFVLKCQQNLDDAGRAGGRLQVADVGLHRPEHQIRILSARFAPNTVPKAPSSMASPSTVPVP